MERLRTGTVRLLRWSERYMQIDMVYAMSGGFWLTVGYLASSVSSFVLAVVFANLLDPNVYGTYKYILSVTSVLAISVLPGIDSSLVRAVSRGKEGTMFVVMRTRVLWGIGANTAALLIAFYYWYSGNASIASAFVVVAFFISILDPLASYDDLLRGRGAFRSASALAITGQIASTVLLCAAAVWSPSLFFIVLAYFGGWTCIRGLLFLYTLRVYPPNTERDSTAIPYGKHLTVMKAANTIASSIGSILLFHISGVQLAIFSIAVAPIEQLRGLLGLIESLVFPKFSRETWAMWSLGTLVRKTWIFFASFTFCIGVYIAVSPYLFAFLFPKYLASVPYTQLWSLSLMITIYTTLLGSMLRAKQEVRKLYVFNTASIVTTLVFTPPLTYFYGIWGLLAGQFATKSVELVLLFVLIFFTAPSAEKPTAIGATTPE